MNLRPNCSQENQVVGFDVLCPQVYTTMVHGLSRPPILLVSHGLFFLQLTVATNSQQTEDCFLFFRDILTVG